MRHCDPINALYRLLRLLSPLMLASVLLAAAHADVVTYFHNDIAGTPMAATDANGHLLWKESYRPYGERLLQTAPPSDNALWFSGKPQDPATGLSYLGARYYNPQLGRFMGIDPKEVDPNDLHSFNRYAYGNNNPYKFVDPDGRAAETLWDAFNIALGLTSFRSNVREGNYGSAALDAVGIAIDSVAAAVPFIPGGAGSILKVGREGAEVTAKIATKAPSGGSPALKGDPYHPDSRDFRLQDWQKLYGGFDPKTIAQELGYSQRIPPQKAPFDSHGQPVFSNGKGYISPDVDGHNVTNGWKMFDIKGRRTGTWNSDLSERLKD